MNHLDEIIVTDITGVLTISAQKGKFQKMNNRKTYGLSLCTQGQITYSHKGKEYVSVPQYAVILPKGETYTSYCNKNGVFPLINFECVNFSCDKICVLPVRNYDSLLKDFERIKSLSLFKENRLKIMSVFYNMISTLSNSDTPESRIIYPAMQYLDNHFFSADITNKELADLCNISEVYFRKLFEKVYGISPHQYIVAARISKAKQLLSEGLYKIKAISEMCGFSSTYHFCRIFKQKTGITPTEYMKQNRSLNFI